MLKFILAPIIVIALTIIALGLLQIKFAPFIEENDKIHDDELNKE